MLTSLSDLHGNQLLRGLPCREWQALAVHLELVELKSSDVLCCAGQRMRYAYFPISATVSLVQDMEDGRSIEVAAVGREGTTGSALLADVDVLPWSIEVQCAGAAYRIPTSALKEQLKRCEYLRRCMTLYVQVLFTRAAQLAACHQHHSVEQRLCRWILDAVDATLDDTIDTTQQRIADLLCVRREGITGCVVQLQKAGLIYPSRGRVRMINRRGMEARACECYAITRNEVERLLSVRLVAKAA
ncbi:Crp/Fnr family transcriptional regulator [Caballeronia humi]|uniref:Crp/FNR family transcriptional regulator n=1 Tax=Caballeronia humi TaxID=326474 RepID=A0A158JM39_9BURK|nr:Crp/Fnr family transcriptional regulator [Caballeronia humi]SAL69808.1 Crp/FNR family transcriptional regulator [Caballeronia humi]